MLPLMIFQVIFGDKSHLTDLTLVGFLTFMLDSDMFVDAGLVKGLVANGTLG